MFNFRGDGGYQVNDDCDVTNCDVFIITVCVVVHRDVLDGDEGTEASQYGTLIFVTYFKNHCNEHLWIESLLNLAVFEVMLLLLRLAD